MIKQLHEAWFIHHACMRFMCLHCIFKTQFTIYYNFTILLQFFPVSKSINIYTEKISVGGEAKKHPKVH